MSDSGTTALLASIITHLLTFAPKGGGATISTKLSARLWAIRAPDNSATPHGVVRVMSRTQSGDDASLREEGRIELQLFGRPLKQSVDVEYCADVAEAALLKFSANYGGLFDVRARVTRDTLPPPPSPGDREIAQVRVVWAYSWWPDYRTQYAVAVGDAP